MNPAREVKTERFSRTEGKTPPFVDGEVQTLLNSIDIFTHVVSAIALYSAPLKPPNVSPATPTAGPRSFMTAADRRCCSRTWRGFAGNN